MFARLLTSLKGVPLNENENELVDEIVNYWLEINDAKNLEYLSN
jgi:hypothetical protein